MYVLTRDVLLRGQPAEGGVILFMKDKMGTSQRDMFYPKPPPPEPRTFPVAMAKPKVEAPTIQNNPPPKKDLRKVTEAWILYNPEVAKLFLRFARELAARGRPFGIGLITERVRYECAIAVNPEQFKVNNNMRSYLARWLIAQDPSLEKWMSFRKVQY